MICALVFGAASSSSASSSGGCHASDPPAAQVSGPLGSETPAQAGNFSLVEGITLAVMHTTSLHTPIERRTPRAFVEEGAAMRLVAKWTKRTAAWLKEKVTWENIVYEVPWALLVMILVVGYVVAELRNGGLKPSEGVSAIVGIAGLAIGHGVHEHARHRKRPTDPPSSPHRPDRCSFL